MALYTISKFLELIYQLVFLSRFSSNCFIVWLSVLDLDEYTETVLKYCRCKPLEVLVYFEEISLQCLFSSVVNMSPKFLGLQNHNKDSHISILPLCDNQYQYHSYLLHREFF